MRHLKLTVAYDGTRFVGWQRQADGQSIQGLLEDAFARVAGAPVTVHGAGRTDAGVHALGQVASASLASGLDLATLSRALNANLPEDVRILGIEDVEAGFHARFSALAKTYRYQLRAGGVGSPFDRAFVWQLSASLDVGEMSKAAPALVGEHNFAAFQSTGSDVQGTVRTITRSEVREGQNGLVLYEIAGTGFLRHMVRAIVGTLVDIGRGCRSASSISALLRGGTRAEAGPTAPAHGLFLVRVDYD